MSRMINTISHPPKDSIPVKKTGFTGPFDTVMENYNHFGVNKKGFSCLKYKYKINTKMSSVHDKEKQTVTFKHGKFIS